MDFTFFFIKLDDTRSSTLDKCQLETLKIQPDSILNHLKLSLSWIQLPATVLQLLQPAKLRFLYHCTLFMVLCLFLRLPVINI